MNEQHYYNLWGTLNTMADKLVNDTVTQQDKLKMWSLIRALSDYSCIEPDLIISCDHSPDND